MVHCDQRKYEEEEQENESLLIGQARIVVHRVRNSAI